MVTIADHGAAEFGARLVFAGTDELPERLTKASALVAAGELTLSVAHTYPLSEAAQAHRKARTATCAAS